MTEPFRWPRREGGPGCVHVVVGDSSYGVGREQTACNCNFRKDGYNRTVAPVSCHWCLEAVREARGPSKEPSDVRVHIIRTIEKEKGVDQTITVEEEARRQDA